MVGFNLVGENLDGTVLGFTSFDFDNFVGESLVGEKVFGTNFWPTIKYDFPSIILTTLAPMLRSLSSIEEILAKVLLATANVGAINAILIEFFIFWLPVFMFNDVCCLVTGYIVVNF